MDSSSSPSADLDRYRYSYSPALHWSAEVEEYFVKAYGADHFARISKALTHPSCYSCIRVNTLKSTTDAVIRKLMAILDEKNLSNTMGCMNIGKPSAIDEVDQVMRQGSFNGTSIYKCEYPGLESVVFVRGSGPHMLDYGDQPAQSMKEVIVSRKCAEAVLRGAQVYVPGVVACSSHVEKGDMVAVSVAVEQPDLSSRWGVGITRGTVLQGLQSDPHYHERSGLYIGQGTALLSRAGIFRASEGIAVDMTNRVYDLPSFNGVLEGEIFLQNLPSIVTALVLG